MKLHLPSVLASLGVVLLVVLLSSQGTLVASGFRIEFMPHPRDMVQIREGTAFVVPAGKLFVLTGLGAIMPGPRALRVNGVQELSAGWHEPGPGIAEVVTVAPVPLGFTVAAGSTVEVGAGAPNGPGRAWGYLANP